jgi:ankyrin repeat protein
LRTPLHIAACYGKEDIALYLINRGQNVNSTDRWKKSPLFYALDNGHERIVRLLMSH